MNRKALRKALWGSLKADGTTEKKTGVVAFIFSMVSLLSLVLSFFGIGLLFFFPFLIVSLVLGIIAIKKKRQTGFAIAAVILSGGLLAAMVILLVSNVF